MTSKINDRLLAAHERIFSLRLTEAMRRQLLDDLESLDPAPLNTINVNQLQKRPGVYMLFVDEVVKYVGKADKDLQARLRKHYRKLSGRAANLVENCTFKVLYIDEDLSAFGPEELLIKAMKDRGQAVWNFNGFGNNDPGRQRDTTTVKPLTFDAMYPIDLDITVSMEAIEDSEIPVQTVLNDLKKELPYLLRYDTDLPEVAVSVPPPTKRTARHWIELIVEALPSEWMATALPGYIILYRENDPEKYESRLGTWIKNDGGVEYFDNAADTL